MKSMRPAVRPAVRLAAAVLCTAAAAAPALGVQDAAETPPQPGRSLTLQSPIAGYAVMALFAAGLVGISLMRSRRGAQD